jgi:hypothetical protein
MMLTADDERIKERVRKYLMRDETGIRKTVLKLFLEDRVFTTEAIYKYLSSKNFDVNYRGVSAMVGLMNTRLGILSIDVKGDHNIYSLKEEYRDAVKSVLENY